MSARAVVEVYRASRSRDSARLVAIALADVAANDGEGIVSRDQLQTMTRLPVRRLESAVQELKRIGELHTPFDEWPLAYELRVGALA